MAATGRPRRRHAAPAARALAVGVSSTAFFGGVAALGATAKPSWDEPAPSSTVPPTTSPPTTAAPAPPAPPPTVHVVERRTRVIYVDENGNPIGATPPPARTRTPAASSSSAPAPAPASPPPTAAPAPPPTPPPTVPSCSGSQC